MAFNFAALKAETRQIVHDTFAFAATHPMAAEPLRVRFHTKIRRFGDLIEQGWAEVIEGVDRLIFNQRELDEQGVLLKTGDLITAIEPEYAGFVFVLHAQEPDTGPVETIWSISKK